MRWLGDRVDIQPEGYAIDRRFLGYLLRSGERRVQRSRRLREMADAGTAQTHQLILRACETYVLPWGTKIRLEKQTGGTAWRLVASRADPTLCHKPCTVSGGGKSEISKSIGSIMLARPHFRQRFRSRNRTGGGHPEKGFLRLSIREARSEHRAKRPILSPERSLGLRHQADDAFAGIHGRAQPVACDHSANRPPTAGYGEALLPSRIGAKTGASISAVDRINGFLGNELKFENQKLVGNYLRMGYDPNGSWRIYKLRPDFNPADKVQVEDDITASVVLPRKSLEYLDAEYHNPSVKLVKNCENLLFQRPDDAIHRGFDKEAERDHLASGHFSFEFRAARG